MTWNDKVLTQSGQNDMKWHVRCACRV